MTHKFISRRRFIGSAIRFAGYGGLVASMPLPAWAASGQNLSLETGTRERWDLHIGPMPITVGGRDAVATGINGSIPGPLLRFKEGQRVALNVSNGLGEDSSIHWHGLILPSNMDGVPGLSFDGIRPGETFHYEFDIQQNGTYWYHSHSDLQEQTGVYGPIVIDPAGPDPVDFDREFVIFLSDWTFEDPQRVLANLKKMDDYYNRHRLTAGDLAAEASRTGLRAAIADRSAWAAMRMTKTDISDVSGATYTYLLNGRDAVANWTGLFAPGERVRLRIINGSAMSFFNVRIPGLSMTVVQSDGQNVEPFDVDEFQIGVAETYDIVVTPGDTAYTIMAESTDRSGFVRGTLAPRSGMSAAVPPMRKAPLLTMQDMGMDHGDMGGHHGHQMSPTAHDHRKGPGVANLNMAPISRLDHPGIGLENVPHRVLRYTDLKSLRKNTDPRKPQRSLELHLTGNMHRYMWSFDGLKFSEVKDPIPFRYGERLRMVLVNDTMMAHPIHLHGMFVELVNGNGAFNPRKHTVVVKPAERLAVDVTADQPGIWAFHCHLLYHMKAGMMRAVRVSNQETSA